MNHFQAFDHLFDSVLVLNQQREIVYYNHQACVFFKLPPRLMKQKKDLSEICFSSEQELSHWIGRGTTHTDTILSPEMKLKISQDPENDLFVVIKLIPLDALSSGHVALVFLDMTVEKQLHLKYRQQLEELKKTHLQILQADKLTTLGELTANISHEINNPLTIAAGHSEIIKDLLQVKDPMSKRDLLQKANLTVCESIERVNQIIRNMKDFLHQSEDVKEYCELESMMEAAIEWIQPTASKAGVRINKDFTSHKTVALANRIKIEQVIINLIKNSIDAISEQKNQSGEITISLSHSSHDHQTYIDITDNGPGISESIKGNLFRPFTSTKEAGSGTGLGLSICSKIIESHKGKLELIESPQGCHFRIRLPSIEVYSYTRNDRALIGKKSKGRILVLDNEVQILNILNTFFAEEGYVFIGSSDPMNATSFLEKADVDLVITDISMPGMDGDEFARLARTRGYRGPILYMTSSKNVERYNHDRLELGISGLILKPFNKEDVMSAIGLTLGAKRGAA